MAVRLHTTVDSRNWYWSSFNPSMTFGTLQAAQNYERLHYLDENFQAYIKFYRNFDCLGDSIEFKYDPQLSYFYEPRISGLQERETAEPIFWTTNRDDDKSFFYYVDQAKSVEIRIAEASDDEKGVSLYKRTKKLNQILKTLKDYWQIELPTTPGLYNFSKLEGWVEI